MFVEVLGICSAGAIHALSLHASILLSIMKVDRGIIHSAIRYAWSARIKILKNRSRVIPHLATWSYAKYAYGICKLTEPNIEENVSYLRNRTSCISGT